MKNNLELRPELSTMPLRERKKLVSGILHSALKEHGFKRSGLRWNLRDKDIIHVVTLQFFSFSDESLLACRVNFGVVVESVYKLIWGSLPKGLYSDEHCVFRMTFPDSSLENSRWLELSDQSGADQVSGEITQGFVPKLVNTLQRIHSGKDILDMPIGDVSYYDLGNAGILSHAVLQSEFGDIRLVEEILSKIKGEAWQQKVEDIWPTRQKKS